MIFALWLACKLPPPPPLPEAPALGNGEPLVAAPDAVAPTPLTAQKDGTTATVVEEAVVVAGPRVLVRHILIAYEGSPGASPELRRSKAEAYKLAREVRDRLAKGEDFATLAKELSDDEASARDGGRLPPFGPGAMVKEFEAAAFALPEGALSEPVESTFGYHVIHREPLVERHLAHIMVQWSGSTGATEVTRTKEEARARIDEALAKVRAGEPFADVARAYSDGPNAARGGDAGVLQKGQMAPQFDAVGFALEVGQVSEIVESPFGFHIVTRLE